MKILYISSALFPSQKSHTLSIMRMCQAFSDFGHEVVLGGVRPKKDMADPIAYYGLKGGFLVKSKWLSWFFNNKVTNKLLINQIIMAFSNKKLIKEFEPDIIYSRLTLLDLLLVPKDKPIIYEMHSLGYLGKSVLTAVFFRWIVRKKNFIKIIVTTTILKEILQKEFPDLEIVVARLSAEPPVEVAQSQLEQFRKTQLLGAERFSKHVGYTGYLDMIGLRGTDVLCQTAALMPNVAFHIVGGEPEILKYWQEYAASYNQHGNIFFYGYRNPSEIPLFLNAFDVVLAPLQYRPSAKAPTGANMSPLKIPQYMSYKKSIIASYIPSHREVLRDEQNALLVAHDNPDAWRTAIQRLLNDDDLRLRIGQQAQADYYAEFTPDNRVKKILEGLI
jgi:glycosyltransferase involved in cell wall biosynthesis